MIRPNQMVFVICLHLLSQVGESWEQSDSCSYEGQQVTGEFTIPGFCLLYRCIPGQGVTAIGCGIRIPPDGCYVEHPNTKNFPECCYTRVVCPDANSINPLQRPQVFDQFSANTTEELGYPKPTFGFSPSPSATTTRGGFNSQKGYPTDIPQPVKNLSPPAPGGVTPIFRPKSAQKKGPNEAFKEPQNLYEYRDNKFGGSPYYYRK